MEVLIHYACNIKYNRFPLNEFWFEKELNFIKDVIVQDGYSSTDVNKILKMVCWTSVDEDVGNVSIFNF